MVGFRKPNNAVLVAGQPIVQELVVKTATNMTPGVVVKRDTDDQHIQVATDGDANVLGFVDVTHKVGIGDSFSADDVVKVLSGPCVVRAILEAGEVVTKGDYLVIGTNGRLKKATAMDGSVDAGATTVTSTAANGDIITLSGGIPPEGVIVARAEESVDASGGEAGIVVRCLI